MNTMFGFDAEGSWPEADKAPNTIASDAAAIADRLIGTLRQRENKCEPAQRASSILTLAGAKRPRNRSLTHSHRGGSLTRSGSHAALAATCRSNPASVAAAAAAGSVML